MAQSNRFAFKFVCKLSVPAGLLAYPSIVENALQFYEASPDNALAETINGPYKAEVIHRLGPWKTAEAVEWETLKWVDWFNKRRLLEPIGSIPPAEAEERYYAQKTDLDMVA